MPPQQAFQQCAGPLLRRRGESEPTKRQAPTSMTTKRTTPQAPQRRANMRWPIHAHFLVIAGAGRDDTAVPAQQRGHQQLRPSRTASPQRTGALQRRQDAPYQPGDASAQAALSPVLASTKCLLLSCQLTTRLTRAQATAAWPQAGTNDDESRVCQPLVRFPAFRHVLRRQTQDHLLLHTWPLSTSQAASKHRACMSAARRPVSRRLRSTSRRSATTS